MRSTTTLLLVVVRFPKASVPVTLKRYQPSGTTWPKRSRPFHTIRPLVRVRNVQPTTRVVPCRTLAEPYTGKSDDQRNIVASEAPSALGEKEKGVAELAIIGLRDRTVTANERPALLPAGSATESRSS